MTSEQIAEAQLVSKVPLRNFRGAWSEAQVREWASGPVKDWLDKTAVFFSMLKPQNWHHSNHPRVADLARMDFKSARHFVSDAQANLDRLLAQPYSPSATLGILRNLRSLIKTINYLTDSSLEGGPGQELISELGSHSVDVRQQ